MQQEFKWINEVLANLGERYREEENIWKLQSDKQMKTPSPIGREIRIGSQGHLSLIPIRWKRVGKMPRLKECIGSNYLIEEKWERKMRQRKNEFWAKKE